MSGGEGRSNAPWGVLARRHCDRGAGKADVHRFRGEQGDWIVMVTDGILCGREDIWIRDLMTAYQGDSPSDLAQRILQQSEEICQGEDDGTVLAVHLERGKEG